MRDRGPDKTLQNLNQQPNSEPDSFYVPRLPTLIINILCKEDYNREEPNILYVLPDQTIDRPIFFRIPLSLYPKKNIPAPIHLSLCWLTISQTTILVTKISFHCKIQVTGNAKLIANNCEFQPYRFQAKDPTIEIFAASNGYFTKCLFTQATKAAVLVHDKSNAVFNECKFLQSETTSILCMDYGYICLDNCEFTNLTDPEDHTSPILKDGHRFSIYCYRFSYGYLTNCKFHHIYGKAIFLFMGSKIQIQKSRIWNCLGGGISCSENSSAFLRKCVFLNIKNSALHAQKNSTIKAIKTNFLKCSGNGVNFEYSQGYVFKCNFLDFSLPAIAVFGYTSNPNIYDIIVDNTPLDMKTLYNDLSLPFIPDKEHPFSIHHLKIPSEKTSEISSENSSEISSENSSEIPQNDNQSKLGSLGIVIRDGSAPHPPLHYCMGSFQRGLGTIQYYRSCNPYQTYGSHPSGKSRQRRQLVPVRRHYGFPQL